MGMTSKLGLSCTVSQCNEHIPPHPFSDCIPNYPDRNLPTVLLYHEGSCLRNLVGLGMLGGPRTTSEREFGHVPMLCCLPILCCHGIIVAAQH